MGFSLTLDDTFALSDLRVFLERAARIDDTATRLIAKDGVVAVYVGVLFPSGLFDSTPTVLGLRTWRIAPDETFDTVVSIRSILDRIARVELPEVSEGSVAGPISVPIPPMTTTVSWAGIAPPRGGWDQTGLIDITDLRDAAHAGIDEVANAVPNNIGESIVRKVRGEVWGRPVADGARIPTGAGFAAVALGFISDKPDLSRPGRGMQAAVRDAREAGGVPVLTSGTWQRISLQRGHILIRNR